jgi:hypothetical protein
LLKHGALTKVKNRNGWNVLQEAVAANDEEVVKAVYRGLVEAAQQRLPEKLAKASARLNDQSDFYCPAASGLSTALPGLNRKYALWFARSDGRLTIPALGSGIALAVQELDSLRGPLLSRRYVQNLEERRLHPCRFHDNRLQQRAANSGGQRGPPGPLGLAIP